VTATIHAHPDWPSNPVLPRDFVARYGHGSDRALVISGGGLSGLAWGAAYLQGLAKAGLDLSTADLVVGTSAGSLLGAVVLAKDLRRFNFQLQLAAKSKLFEFIRKDSDPHESAAHARAMFDDATDGDEETLLRIGHAALAAKAPSKYAMYAQISAFVGRMKWPSSALRTTAYDTYTAQRLVFCRQSGVPLLSALSASAAVPGLMTPVQIGQRRCMDGGMVSGSNIDIAAGSRKTLVLGLVHDPEPGRWTNRPGMWNEELASMRAAGTLTAARLPAEELGDPMDATTLPFGLRLGAEQAARDAPELSEFWNT